MSDIEIYDRYMKYKEEGSSIDPSGIIGQGIMNDIVKRAGGVENIQGWLYKISLRKRLEKVIK